MGRRIGTDLSAEGATTDELAKTTLLPAADEVISAEMLAHCGQEQLQPMNNGAR
jgi:hypothetical protein